LLMARSSMVPGCERFTNLLSTNTEQWTLKHVIITSYNKRYLPLQSYARIMPILSVLLMLKNKIN